MNSTFFLKVRPRFHGSFRGASAEVEPESPSVSMRHDDPFLNMTAEGSDVRSANTSASLVF